MLRDDHLGGSSWRRLTRRGFLGGLGVAATALVAACTSSNGATTPTSPQTPSANATPASALAGSSPTTAGNSAATATAATGATTPASAVNAGAGTPTAATGAAAATSPTAAATSAAAAGTTPTAAATTAAAGTTPTAAATAGTAGTTPTAAAAAGTGPVALGTPLPHVGGSVSVLATWGGNEQNQFMAAVKPFQDQTGVNVQYTGTRDLNAVLATRVQAGNPPDLAGLPGPGVMIQYAKNGKLVDLSTVFDMTTLKDQISNQWIQLGTINNKLVGVFMDASIKGLIWYDPVNIGKLGIQQPKTWDDMMATSQKIASSGTTPWSIGLESGASSGWPGSDWVKDFMLRQAGPDPYVSWYQGTLKWTSPEVTAAWESWGKIVGDPKMVYGGPQYMLATNFGNAADPLFSNPPKAYFHHQASFMASFIEQDNPSLKPITDFTFWTFPEINSQYAGAAVGAGDLFGMFKKTDQSTALIRWLMTPQAQSIWIQKGGTLSTNNQVPLSAYPDKISQNAVQAMQAAKIIRFDAGDMMPDQMQTGFWKAVLSFVQNPGQLSTILKGLDTTQAQAYKT
jgi:alpha-glucoside transport system substrate-binding protein